MMILCFSNRDISSCVEGLYHTDRSVLLGVHESLSNDSLTLSLNPNPDKVAPVGSRWRFPGATRAATRGADDCRVA